MLVEASEGNSVVEASAVAPVNFTKVRLVNFLLTRLSPVFGVWSSAVSAAADQCRDAKSMPRRQTWSK